MAVLFDNGLAYLAVSYRRIPCLFSAQHLSLLADNGADGVREGFVMHGCPVPDCFSVLSGRSLYVFHAAFAACLIEV